MELATLLLDKETRPDSCGTSLTVVNRINEVKMISAYHRLQIAETGRNHLPEKSSEHEKTPALAGGVQSRAIRSTTDRWAALDSNQ